MECKNCHAKFGWEPKEFILLECPFCSSSLETEPAAPEKPSFDWTWGDIFAQNLKKSRNTSQSDYDQTLSYYVKGWKENPAYGWMLADFLEQTTLTNKQTKELILPELSDSSLPEKQLAAVSVLVHSCQKKDRAAYEKLIHLDSCLSDPDVHQLVEQISSMPEFQTKIPSAKAIALAREGKQKDAARLIFESMELDHDMKFYLLSDQEYALFTGCSLDAKERVEQVRNALKKETVNMDAVVQLLARPVEPEQQAFDHLNDSLDLALPYIREHQTEFFAAVRKVMKQGGILRGFHLLLTLLKTTEPEMSDQIAPLLDLQYEKVYMKPYDWISKTDRIWSPKTVANFYG